MGEDVDAGTADEPRRTHEPSGVVDLEAPPTVRDIRDATVIKEGDLFLLTDLEGNVPRGNANGFGLYVQDTRFLSSYELRIEQVRPIILLSGGRSNMLGAQVLTNPSLTTPEGQLVHEHTIQIRRYRLLRAGEVNEALTIHNFNRFPLTLAVALHFDADFADIFEVRGIAYHAEAPRRRLALHEGVLHFARDGCDGLRRSTAVRFDPTPRRVSEGTASYELALPPGGAQRIAIAIRVAAERVAVAPGEHCATAPDVSTGPDVAATSSAPTAPTTPDAATRPSAPPVVPAARVPPVPRQAWISELPAVETSSGLFNELLAQSRADLRVLLTMERGLPYVAAGIPWYATLFGRDSLVTALQDLWMSPPLAKHTLRLLAQLQGRRDDRQRDEEPGKILHELRRGELANCGLVPFAPYYGTVDATPLWVLLLGEYVRATADTPLAAELRPNLEAALEWIDRYGDIDGDGFVEYRSRSDAGLVNQGWKDSWDGLVHADGSLPKGPIALVEVQGYVYAARRAAARVFRALGEGARAAELEAAAARLREAFDAAFWLEREGCYCLALDGEKRPLAVATSNAGHPLWSGIATPARAERVAQRLLGEDLFSGWGVRTLSTREVAYNPAGYHLGTVWPHDNALIALGLKRYRQESCVVEIITGLYDAAQHFPHFRMPELFCGFARSAFGVPVRYPVACSPQAWAASSWSALLQAMLGVQPHARSHELRIVRPSLPPWLHWVRVRNLAVGESTVDLRYERVGDHTAVDVEAMRGPVRVAFVDDWDADGWRRRA